MENVKNTEVSEKHLPRNALGLAHVVFFVVAAAAPLAAIVGGTPPAFALGNGPGVPGAFILTGVLYLIFAVGFTTIARHVKGAGAYYTFITRGINGIAGMGGGFMAIAAYYTMEIAVYALFGVFVATEVGPLGLSLPWWVWAFAILCVVTFCGQRNIEISGRILGVCMLAEITILLILNIAIIFHAGHGNAAALSTSGFRPSEVFGHGLGLTLVFVFGAYIGIEATAIFGEEAKTPERTIPRATYIAIASITIFYAFTTWAIVQYYGPNHIQDIANKSMATFYFTPAQSLLGDWSEQIMNILVLTSLFACLLALHNTLNRYVYCLGREGVVWRFLASVHIHHGSPHIASWLQSSFVLITLVAFVLGHADPYAVIFSWLSALAALGILAVQALTSIAVIVFFRRTSYNESFLSTVVAPVLAAIGLVVAFILVSFNLGLLTGSSSLLVKSFPWVILGIGIIGALLGMYLRQARPETYAALGRYLI